MRILVFSWRDPKHPLAGGAEQSMHQHMIGWKEAGHEVTLFSSKVSNLTSTETIDGIKMVRDGNQYLGVQIKGFLYYLKNRNNYDLVIDQFHGIPFFTPLYVNKPKIAVVQEVARKVWLLNYLKFPLNIIVGLIGYIFDPMTYLLYKKVPFMVGSDSAKKDLSKYGIANKNITVVPHGVIVPDNLVKYKKSETKTVIFLGSLSKDKGIIDAIKCFSILNGNGNYQFWIVGQSQSKSYLMFLKRFARNLGLYNNIKFFGYVDDAKKFKLLGKAHILVNPSVHEGWGLVNIEANATRTPVVAYKSSGLIDSVKNGVSGIICSNNNPNEMAKEVEYLLSNKSNYKKYQDNAYKWSLNFTWKRSRKMSLQLINKSSII